MTGHGHLSAWQEHCAKATRDQLSNAASLAEYLDAFPAKQVQEKLSHTLLADQADVLSLITDLSAGMNGLIPSAHAMLAMATATHAKMADQLVLETVAKIKELAARGQTYVHQRVEELPSGQQIAELDYSSMEKVFARASEHLRTAEFEGTRALQLFDEEERMPEHPMFWCKLMTDDYEELAGKGELWMHIVWRGD